jgi:mRNA (guanine-N7-)-methyltransferase
MFCEQSKILRSFHNNVKRSLIKSVSSSFKRPVLLDIGVGRGGDMHKWKDCGIYNAVGVDPNDSYIKEANKRYKQMRNVSYKFLTIIPGDLFTRTLLKADVQSKFNIISCQFAMHYLCSSEIVFSQFISTISDRLSVGEYFIGTIPDGDAIIKLLDGQCKYTNTAIYIEREKHGLDQQFGDKIKFSLAGTLYFGENSISDECLVYKNLICKVCKTHNLQLVEWTPFADYKNLFNERSLISDFKDASYINSSFIFKKC